MKKSRASLRYAKSILLFSEENNTSKEVALDMQKLSDLMQVNSDLQTALENPLIANEKKLMILNGLFPDTSESTKKLFSLMADNNRLAILAESGYHFLELYAISNKITKATVTSVSPLSSDLKEILYKKAKTFSKGELKIFGQGMINASNKIIKVPDLSDHRLCMSSFILALLTGANAMINNFETVFTSSPSFLKIMKNNFKVKFEIKK